MVVSELSLEGTPGSGAARLPISNTDAHCRRGDRRVAAVGWTSGGIALIEGDGGGGAGVSSAGRSTSTTSI